MCINGPHEHSTQDRMKASASLATWLRSPRVRAGGLGFAALVSAVLAVPSVQTTTAGDFASVVAAAPAQLVKNIERVVDQQYLGFDTNIYPGDRAMEVWAKDGTYDWVGYYLPAPCHRDESWSGKREVLSRMGWGLAVVYVGQQVWPTKKKTKKGSTCSTAFVTAARGKLDGRDAIGKVVAEGFPHGTVIFLDIERMDNVTPAMRAYYKAWTQTVLRDGRYRPGYYTHADNAAKIYADVKTVFAAASDTTEPPFWVAGRSNVFTVDKMPADVGHAFAAVWQGLLDVTRTHNGIKLPVDINVSGSRSPSESNASP
jgi:hypothetical protein